MATGGVNFKTFQLAVTALTQCGVSGAVTFNVSPGTYNEQIVLPQINGTSATKTVTFQSLTGDSTSVTLNYLSNFVSYPYTLYLNGADYFIFKKITLKASGPTYAKVILIDNGSTNNLFTNNRIIGVPVTSVSTDYALIYSPLGSTDNGNIFSSNLFLNGSMGLYYCGGSVGSEETGTQVVNNILSNQYVEGIDLSYQDAPLISGNNISTNTSFVFYGISTLICDNNLRILKNNQLL